MTKSPSLLVSEFVQQWKDCQKCPLCERRTHVVLYQGSIPAKVLFIGEAPGPSEDLLARPFAGPSGNVFRQIMNRVAAERGRSVSYCVTNVVCCFPEITSDDIEAGLYPDGTQTGIRDPNKEEILACQPRLMQFVDLVKPQLVIRLGKVAASSTAPILKLGIRMENLLHPGAILRVDNPAEQQVHITRCVNRIKKWTTHL